MVRTLEETANVREMEVIAAAMREAFAGSSGSPGGSPGVSPAQKAASERLQSLTHAFPGYEIVREIHRGGQGVVYQALQKSTQRQVAVKVMRDGPFADPSDRARFEREVQVLAQLDHPNVVAIHDSGVAHDRFYYVMDYIPGRALDEFVAEEDPSIENLLRLFQSIAEAVNAAHLRGVTHRDLKPSNVLVVCDDGTKGKSDSSQSLNPSVPRSLGPLVPHPKILDFGLAKLANPMTQGGDGSGDATLPVMTISGQFVGSLPWASPEQAEGAPAKIDIRTDVYSLGVMLYQMLTGRFPYPVVGPMREVVDHILKTEPVRPSTIRRRINDEIETIVLKCLHKERDRRYQSAAELARDIGRYLAGEPIEAKRDSGWYVIRKTLGRYKGPVAVAGAFLALIVTAAVVLWVMYGQVASAQQKTRQAFEFVQGIMNSDYLAKAARNAASAQEVLDDAVIQIDRQELDPAVEADMRGVVGRAYFTVSLLNPAETQLRRALELRRGLYPEGHASLINTLNDLGECRKEQGDNKEALALHEEARVKSLRLLGDDSPELATSLHNLGSSNWWLKHYDVAREMFEGALAIRLRLFGNEHRHVAYTLTELSLTLDKLGDHQEAEQLARQTLDMRQRLLGPTHSSIADAMNNLAICLMSQGRFQEAEPLLRDAIKMNRETVGEHHLHLSRMIGNLGRCARELGNYAEADLLLNDALARKDKQLGRHHFSTAKTLSDLAKLRLLQERAAEAESLCREALNIQKELEHPDQEDSQKLLDQILSEQTR